MNTAGILSIILVIWAAMGAAFWLGVLVGKAWERR